MLTLLTATSAIGALAAATGGSFIVAGFIGLVDHLSRR